MKKIEAQILFNGSLSILLSAGCERIEVKVIFPSLTFSGIILKERDWSPSSVTFSSRVFSKGRD